MILLKGWGVQPWVSELFFLLLRDCLPSGYVETSLKRRVFVRAVERHLIEVLHLN